MGISVPPLEDLISTHAICCATEGKSQRTIEWYESNVKRFCRFLRDQQPNQTVPDIGVADARSFIHHLQNGVRRWQDCPSINDTKGLSPDSSAILFSFSIIWTSQPLDG